MYNPDYFSEEELEMIQNDNMYYDEVIIPAQKAYMNLLRKYKKSTNCSEQISA